MGADALGVAGAKGNIRVLRSEPRAVALAQLRSFSARSSFAQSVGILLARSIKQRESVSIASHPAPVDTLGPFTIRLGSYP